MRLSRNYQSTVVTGVVEAVNPDQGTSTLKLLSGDFLTVAVSRTTWYEVLRNVGDEGRDRTPEPDADAVLAAIGRPDDAAEKAMWDAKRKLLKYLRPGVMVSIRGVYSEEDGSDFFSARRVVLMHSTPGRFGWEETHWWLQQINTLFEQWMDVLFQDKRELTENDFAQSYRTNLDLLGGVTADDTQECATMSRFLYGLSSSYLLTGNGRAYSAAKACAAYMINAFAMLSHDQMYCFWKFGRRHDGKSSRTLIGSLNKDDLGSYALYEQIYALAGLTQYYRVSQDATILFYVTRTISAFEKFFRDELRPGDECFTGKGGYFSHIDPVTMRPDSPALGKNRMRKNWNSIGDHIPAYLVNLLLAIDPLPVPAAEDPSWDRLRELCRRMLDDCVDNILAHFPPQDGSLLVNERFLADWTPDHDWDWQQNRGIVGHNLKISWNLTRCAHYYRHLAHRAQLDGSGAEAVHQRRAERCRELAETLGRNMDQVGVDLVRGGVFDALERKPAAGLATDFAWEPTKDFWQQEQAILAYYIMYGREGGNPRFLELARHCAAFWNLYFVDQDNRKIYFRTTESGLPIVQDGFGIQGGHAMAGYHSFELNYLAHLYIRAYVPQTGGGDDTFCITFRPQRNGLRTLNVLPDFFSPGDLKILRVWFDGSPQAVRDGHRFQIDIDKLDHGGEVVVEFLPIRRHGVRSESDILQERSDVETINFHK